MKGMLPQFASDVPALEFRRPKRPGGVPGGIPNSSRDPVLVGPAHTLFEPFEKNKNTHVGRFTTCCLRRNKLLSLGENPKRFYKLLHTSHLVLLACLLPLPQLK